MAMQFNALNGCSTVHEIKSQLKNLPPNLDQTYHQIFARIHTHHRGTVLTILQWLAFAKEPLTLEQICEAVAIYDDKGQPKFDPNRRWNKQIVEMACANLVRITNGNRFPNYC